jgi:putative endonuclease
MPDSLSRSGLDTILVIKFAVFEEPILYIVYLLRCADSTLYCGITNDLEKRLRDHGRGKGARYTRGRLPVRVAYREAAASRSEALKREWAIKKLTKVQKEELCRRSVKGRKGRRGKG